MRQVLKSAQVEVHEELSMVATQSRQSGTVLAVWQDLFEDEEVHDAQPSR
jgi:hypothetical protein